MKGLALLSEAFITDIGGMTGWTAKEECLSLHSSAGGMYIPSSLHLLKVQPLSLYTILSRILLLLMGRRNASEGSLWGS